MNGSMAIPADRFQIVDTVRPTVRTIFSMMNLQLPSGSAADAPIPMRLQDDSAVQHVHAIDECVQRNPLRTTKSLHDQLCAVESPDSHKPAFWRKL